MVKKVHDLMKVEEYITTGDLRFGRLVFLESSSSRMVFIITNLRNNNLEERRPSKKFFIGVNLNPYPYI
jgi:hypothetical protein